MKQIESGIQVGRDLVRLTPKTVGDDKDVDHLFTGGGMDWLLHSGKTSSRRHPSTSSQLTYKSYRR